MHRFCRHLHGINGCRIQFSLPFRGRLLSSRRPDSLEKGDRNAEYLTRRLPRGEDGDRPDTYRPCDGKDGRPDIQPVFVLQILKRKA